jgi:tetratricopeptide (TPR) repeat protein
MAFGFGFNKQKVLSAAEKFVQQGKLQNAITEYEKILKADPKDLTVMNTVGDLYSRLGSADKAVECFKSVGDAYASQGFTVKAIAMYKKLSKLQSSLESVLRLAELYTQQGLFNDARAQYLQVADEFVRTGEFEQAVRIFQKTLEMDPENVAMRTKLAEVYVKLGKKTEAWQLFSAAAETLRGKGQLAPAEDILQRMLTLDPGNGYALLLRGRTAFDSGNLPGCIENLEKVADLDSHPDGLRALFQAYLLTGRLAEAGTLATKLAAVHNDNSAITSYADALITGGQFEDALRVYQEYSDRLLAADADKVLETMHSLIGHIRENPPALEMLLDMLHRAGESTHLTEVYELLAHGYVQSGDLEKARDYYLKLTQLEPENQLHANNYQTILAKIGAPAASKLITAEEGAVMADEIEATAPFVDQRYDDEVALAVRAALTDAELFISYNMPAKALGPLLSVLPQAPRDLQVNQRLAALHTRAGRFAEAAICCRTLEGIYHDAGHPDEATRYGELAGKYEERGSAAVLAVKPPQAAAAPPIAKVAVPVAAAAQPPVAASTLEADVVESTPATQTAAPAPAASGLFFHGPASASTPASSEVAEFDVQPVAAPEVEIDLSQEWEGTLTDESASPLAEAPASVAVGAHSSANAETIASTVDEIRFYLAQGMAEEAYAAFRALEQLRPEASMLADIRSEIESAAAHPPAAQHEVAEISLEEVETPVNQAEEAAIAPNMTAQPTSADEPVAAPVPGASPGVLDTLVADLESSLGDGFLAEPAAASAAEAEIPAAAEFQVQPEHHAAPQPQSPAQFAGSAVQPRPAASLGEFVADLEASLGNDFAPQSPAAENATPAQPQPKAEPAASIAASVPVAQPTKFAAPAAMAAAAATGIAAAASVTAAPPVTSPLTSPLSAVRPRPAAPSGSGPAFDIGPGVDLADMFGELKQELEEGAGPEDEDPETHYNLGVAFREMGLLDEAIGELQKVCQAVDHGHPFTQIMQTYTWLAQCFLDKGVPEAAIRWYERALKLSTIDEETRTALHYELGSSYEISGNKAAALNHFLEVYGGNIDYRDVGERIKALKS